MRTPIRLVRGDSFKMPIELNIGTVLEPEIYELHNGDVVYVALSEPNQPFEESLIKRSYTNADLEEDILYFKLRPEDTENVSEGLYYLSAKLYMPSSGTTTEKVKTIINKTMFFIE